MTNRREPRTHSERWTTAFAASATTEIRCWTRSRVAVGTALVLPVLVATIISVALGSDLGNYKTAFGVVNQDHRDGSALFVSKVFGNHAVADVVSTKDFSSPAEATGALDRGDVSAVIVFPQDMTDRLVNGNPSGVTVERRANNAIAGDLAALLVRLYDIQARAVQESARNGAPMEVDRTLEVAFDTIGGRQLDAATHYGPAIAMFFLMISMGFAAARVVADRERRIIERIAVGRPMLPVLTGRACAVVAIGGLSVLIMAVSTRLFFGRTWGPAPYVALVTVVVIVTFTGLAVIAATLSRTLTQAHMATVGLAVLFALTSGFFSPPGAAASSALARYVPTTFALNAYQALTTGDLAFTSFGVNLVVLTLFAGASVGVAALTARKVI